MQGVTALSHFVTCDRCERSVKLHLMYEYNDKKILLSYSFGLAFQPFFFFNPNF